MTPSASVLETIASWVRRGDRIAIATVVATRGASPQAVGTKMAVNGHGQIAGAVSGGCVEGAVIEAAEVVLADGGPRLMHFADELVGGVGLPCGGEITVWVEPLDEPLVEFLELARRGEAATLVTRLADGHLPVSRRLLGAGEHPGPTDSEVFVDVAEAAPKLIVVGAVAVAAELSAIAAVAGWRTLIADPRPRFATADRFPAAAQVIAAWPEVAFERWAPLDANTAVAVISHDRKIDDEAVMAALASGAGYVGAIGSRRATAARRQRLLAAGIGQKQLERLSSPIGLDLGGNTAAETALSIFAEIIAARNRRDGGRLTLADGPIHAGAASERVIDDQRSTVISSESVEVSGRTTRRP